MQIGEPMQELPSGLRRYSNTRWSSVYAAAEAAKGAWVPVTFENVDDAKSLTHAVRRVRSGRECQQRGLVVYVRTKPEVA